MENDVLKVYATYIMDATYIMENEHFLTLYTRVLAKTISDTATVS